MKWSMMGIASIALLFFVNLGQAQAPGANPRSPRSRIGQAATASATLQGQERKVTDDIAYSHFLLTVAPPPATSDLQNPPDNLADRQTSYIKHVGLNPGQGEILIRIAGMYRAYQENLRAQATQIAGRAACALRFRLDARDAMEAE